MTTETRATTPTAERYWDATARIERLFLLAACPDGEALPEGLEDALDEGADEVLLAHLGVECRRDELQEEWGYLLMTGRLPTLLAEVATPVASHFRKGEHGDSFRVSWGHYHTGWLTADDLDDLTTKVETWSAERLADDRERDDA